MCMCILKHASFITIGMLGTRQVADIVSLITFGADTEPQGPSPQAFGFRVRHSSQWLISSGAECFVRSRRCLEAVEYPLQYKRQLPRRQLACTIRGGTLPSKGCACMCQCESNAQAKPM